MAKGKWTMNRRADEVQDMAFGSISLRTASAFLGVALMLGGCVAAERSTLDDPRVARGQAVTQEWCATCHGIERPVPGAGAPSFAAIAGRPGRDEAYLAAFLREDHFPMTTYRLFEHEKEEVAAFILSLRRS
jgi:mono/diheme cytochrome c family protein